MRVLAPLGLVVAVAAGVWFLGAIVARTTVAAIALTTVWFAVLGLGVVLACRHDRGFVRPLGGTYAAIAAVSVFGLWWGTIRETEVDERLDTGVPASVLPGEQRPDVDALLAPQE
jgi:threonine/homoserine efflux transporter RhtA